MPRLADTSLRLLGQEPLAGRLPSAAQLRLAEIVDRAGFAYLEVSGGGCFQAACARGVESPWERIRAIRARTRTPLAMALRGRFLVGSRPAAPELVRRFIACAAESGIDVFRLHDPLNDLEGLEAAAAAIAAVGRELDIGLVYSPGEEEREGLTERARRLADLGAARVLLHDPSGALTPAAACELVTALGSASGLPVGVYVQGAGGAALAAALEAARAGADLVACAIYPLALLLHRVAAEAAATSLAGLGLDPGIDVDSLWRAGAVVDEYLGEERLPPISPRLAARAAKRRLPPGLVAAVDERLRASGAGDRLDEALEELDRIRGELGRPPLAAPIGQILASQAILHVLSAQRYQTVVDEVRSLIAGRFGRPPAAVEATVRRAVELVSGAVTEEQAEADLEEARRLGEGLAASEEDLCLLALFGEEAEPLLRALRARARPLGAEAGAGEPARLEQIREIVRLVQESGVEEVSVEEAGVKVTVRRGEQAAEPRVREEGYPAAGPPPEPAPEPPPQPGLVRVEAPMVGTFYRSPEPGAPPFVEEGDVVVPGQTLCILEAMKLMNEVKAEVEGVVRRIHVENAQPVEYGQLLFELEPVDGRPPLL
jgi:oxaloacetate decarboxylase alpha subunit